MSTYSQVSLLDKTCCSQFIEMSPKVYWKWNIYLYEYIQYFHFVGSPCFSENTYYDGTYIKNEVKDTAEACKKLCEETSDCILFTFLTEDHPTVSRRKQCYLMSKITTLKHHEHHISGHIPCNGISLLLFLYKYESYLKSKKSNIFKSSIFQSIRYSWTSQAV